MVQPMSGLERGVPSLVINVRIADILELAKTAVRRQ
jgi:hypothetical protein